jgi:pimeloyl-ACP methyl ester carboxylesterase
MKYFFTLPGSFLIILFYASQPCLSQKTCLISTKYGENSGAGKFANVNGIRMYYETYGDLFKQPLLLIHGNGGSIDAGRCQIEYFRDKYYLIVVDSRFHGKTENGSETLTYDIMAKDYDSLLDFLKIDSVFVIGQSDGGIIGLLLAINYPDKVKKLATIAPNLQPDTTAVQEWFTVYVRNELKKVEKKINQGDTSEDLIRQRAQLNLMDKYPDININQLAKIKAQVLVMSSDGDIVKPEHIVKIYQHITKAQLFIMPGATHFMLREEYSLFNQIVERFLSTPFTRPMTRDLL